MLSTMNTFAICNHIELCQSCEWKHHTKNCEFIRTSNSEHELKTQEAFLIKKYNR